MLTKEFDFELPLSTIAQKPVEPRDHSRMLIVDRTRGAMEHRHFFDIVEYLRPGDLLVWNNSKVFKARLFGRLVSKQGETLREHSKPVEVFLVKPMPNAGVWMALAKPGRHALPGTRIVFADDFFCETMVKERDGTVLVQFSDDEEGVREKANRYGSVPLPPYVKDESHELDSYQTVYASRVGSVAAPTAGFHFTPELIETLEKKGVQFAEITLHVGLGTFLPVKSERVEDHTMHSEWVEITEENSEKINRAKANGDRVIAVGTTTVRTLEGAARFGFRIADDEKFVRPYCGEMNLFITPGFSFRIVDAMITNFHLPKSTLLMLVSAFIGNRAKTLGIYKEAIRAGYRFYSFGDAMLIT